MLNTPGFNWRANKPCKRGEITKPCSASSIAGLKSSSHGNVPYCLCALAKACKIPGTPTERPPTTASIHLTALPCLSKNKVSSAFAGAVSRPSKLVSLLFALL